MKKYIRLQLAILLCIITICVSNCKKQDDFLNTKRQLSDVVPSTISDFQAILDDGATMNFNFPTAGYAGTDNIYVVDNNLNSLSSDVIAAYLWQKDIYQGIPGANSQDWDYPYMVVQTTNIVLDGLSNIGIADNNKIQFNNVRGSALFYRAFMFYSLAQVYCKSFDSTSASTDLGIVLRTTSDINAKSTRATVKETYDLLIRDLKEAITLLPVTPAFPMRPSQASANGLLAKIYLAVGNYTDAALYATNSLNQFNTLLDYNSSIIQPANSIPFPPYPKNPEISFYAYEGKGLGLYFATATANIANIDTVLYNSYDGNDLRKAFFYVNPSPGEIYFRGTYSGTFYAFSGIATNEIYLIRAEAYARFGNIAGALSDLNLLLSNRYKAGTYTNIIITDPTSLLAKVLLERRKELPFTGQLRWEDLRRLNKDPRFSVTLTRVSGGATYTLLPNDPRYVFPIPDNEIKLSGIQQNMR